MTDQAQKLRDLVALGRPGGRARVLSVTSGKGGVGKTNVAVSLALALTALKCRVALVDFDLGLANANVLLRCKHRWNLSHYLKGDKSLVDVCVLGPGGLLFMPGANGLTDMADLDDAQRRRLISGLTQLERRVDWIIVDTGAGLSRNVLDVAAAADDVMIVTTPEPTAVLDAYSVIRSLSTRSERGHLRLIVNQAQSRRQAAETSERLGRAAEEFLDVDVDRMGYVLSDPQVVLSVSQRRSFILDNPRCPASVCIETMARSLTDAPTRLREQGFFERLLASVPFLGEARRAG